MTVLIAEILFRAVPILRPIDVDLLTDIELFRRARSRTRAPMLEFPSNNPKLYGCPVTIERLVPLPLTTIPNEPEQKGRRW